MGMDIAAFIQRSMGLSPEARVLIARLMHQSPSRVFEAKEAFETGQSLCLSAAVVRRSLAELCEKALLEPVEVKGDKGRPTKRYSATSHCHALLDEPVRHLSHGWLVERVLLSDRLQGLAEPIGAVGRAGLLERLTASNRLLLCVLLINANRFGVVRCEARNRYMKEKAITEGYLANATGLSRGQLQAQIYKLNRLGFIRFRLSGFSKGERYQTVYFLNLHHPELLDGRNCSRVFVIRGVPPVLERDQALGISTRMDALREQVLWRIDFHVADLLRHPELSWELRSDVIPLPEISMRLPSQVGLQWPDYADAVFKLALFLREVLKPHIGSDWRNIQFCLLPASGDVWSTRVVLVRSIEPDASESPRVICCGAFNEPDFIEPEFARHAGIPGLTAYGLYRPFRLRARHHSPKAREGLKGI